MRVAILSDVHGNVEALRAVLADVDGQAPDALVVCGDMVGYGPDPEEAVAILRQRGAAMLLGNHELGLLRSTGRDWFNPRARRALEVTDHLVTPETLEFLAGLPSHLEMSGAWFVHGFPPDSAHTYLFEKEDGEIADALDELGQSPCFVGHTHEMVLAQWAGGRLTRRDPGPGRLTLAPGAACLVNVGSVGQPRDDWNRNAKYVLWDRDAGTLDFRFVPYDSTATRRKILERGLPPRYAEILEP